MSLHTIPAGKNIPNDIYVIIEIAAKSFPIKYEINKKFRVLYVDRFIPTSMFYPCNYGYINLTLSEDGDPLDVLVLSPYPLQPTSVIRCRPIGSLNMIDESGEDNKIIAVPHSKICSDYNYMKNIHDICISFKKQIQHFFEQYKILEKNKWVKIKNWEDIDVTKEKILAAYFRAKNAKKNN